VSARSAYYEKCRALALAKRADHSVQTAALNLVVMQSIYRAEGITIDRRKTKANRIRAAYYCDDGECSVWLNAGLPREPKLFALTHELKHHYLDQAEIQSGRIECGDYNAHEVIEKAAEVFAAEFIYPETEMKSLVSQLNISNLNCTPEKIVEFKQACRACVSYTFVVKRFEWFGLCPRGAFSKVQFKKLEEELLGVPIYKQPWFRQRRAKKHLRN
jgi:Zn-dependent peptidase ImmA (M78 family)